MDDEILACGGTIAQLKNKESIYIIFITDGRGKQTRKVAPNIDLNKIRTNESRAALNILGISEKNTKFLNFPDGNLKNDFNSLVAELQVIINSIKPYYIFIPFRYDWHQDHIMLNKACINACMNKNFHVTLLEYFVYTRWRLLKKKDMRKYINPELLITVNINNVKELKKKALSCFISQTTNYFENQTHPVLTKEILEQNCNTPEIFLKTDSTYLENVFFSSHFWLSFISWLEPLLKNQKDKILFLILRFRKNFTFHGRN